MAYPFTPQVSFPLDSYRVNSYRFKQPCSYDQVYWGLHLGEDVNRRAGTPVFCIGRGKVVYSVLHSGSAERKNWGNIIIVAHKHPQTRVVFFSLYAHLGERTVQKGKLVTLGQKIGVVGASNTPENGQWKEAHLHFGIYTGPWRGKVLPGYWKKGSRRTQLKYWQNSSAFIKNYRTD